MEAILSDGFVIETTQEIKDELDQIFILARFMDYDIRCGLNSIIEPGSESKKRISIIKCEFRKMNIKYMINIWDHNVNLTFSSFKYSKDSTGTFTLTKRRGGLPGLIMIKECL